MLPDVFRYIGVDGLHPNEAGYTRIAETLLPGHPDQSRSAVGWSARARRPAGCRSLTRTFGDRVAVRDLSLSVATGEIVALLGPNGAGKTTTMRMLAGLILPTAGRISIDRVEHLRSRRPMLARRSVGLLTEAPGLWERLTVRFNLLTYARLQGLDRPHEQVDRVLAEVDLADRADELAGKLSKGLKQRAALARALIHGRRSCCSTSRRLDSIRPARAMSAI